MARFRHGSTIFGAVLSLGVLMVSHQAGAQGAVADTSTGKPVEASTPPQSQATTQYRAAPTVRLLGVPTEIWAPVDPSYTGAAYRTLGGQAETSADAVAEQGTPWR